MGKLTNRKRGKHWRDFPTVVHAAEALFRYLMILIFWLALLAGTVIFGGAALRALWLNIPD